MHKAGKERIAKIGGASEISPTLLIYYNVVSFKEKKPTTLSNVTVFLIHVLSSIPFSFVGLGYICKRKHIEVACTHNELSKVSVFLIHILSSIPFIL